MLFTQCKVNSIPIYTHIPSLHISHLPLEILNCIFDILCSCALRSFPYASYQSSHSLFNCSLVCKRWYAMVMPKVHDLYYLHNIYSKRALLVFSHREWVALCFMAKAALNSHRWSLASLRLFWIQESTDMYKMMHLYPNPCHPMWESILSCTLDVNDVFYELISTSSSSLVHGQLHLQMMLNFSEKMDLGSFLLLFQTQRGLILIRIKPLLGLDLRYDLSSDAVNPLDAFDGKMLLWDAAVFGSCFQCKCTLARLQVCSRCCIAQYCSKECQKLDWMSHRKECKVF